MIENSAFDPFNWGNYHNSVSMMLLDNQKLERRQALKKPLFLKLLEQHLTKSGIQLDELASAGRPAAAQAIHGFIVESVHTHNQRLAAGQDPLRLSPVSESIPDKLERYFKRYPNSLTLHESHQMSRLRRSQLELDMSTARTYLPLGYADLNIAAAFQESAHEFYQGPAAETADELLAAYGAGRERVSFLPIRRSGRPRPDPNYGIPQAPTAS